MITFDQAITRQIPMDRTPLEALRCGLGNLTRIGILHPLARVELRELTCTRKEGRKTVQFSVWCNVQECMGCGRVARLERVL